MPDVTSLGHYAILTSMLAPALLMAATGSLLVSANARLARVASLDRDKRLAEQVSLWQERVGLMSALVDVHFSKATNVDL